MAPQWLSYEYEPLPSATSIRLLRRTTYTSGNTVYGCLAFEIQAFELDDAPAFEALSYTWGDPYAPHAEVPRQTFNRNEHWVLLNGQRAYVTPNLYEGLGLLTKQRFINIGDRDNDNKTPLHIAAERGDAKQVRALLRAGADVAAQAFIGYENCTALQIAYRKGHLEVVKELTRPEHLGRYLKELEHAPMDDKYRDHETFEHVKALVGHNVAYDGYWWVDAICINQADLGERASQVRLMSRIYSTARHVPVWLGGVDDRFNRCKWALEDQAKDQPPVSIPKDTMVATADFFKRKWFSRTWVIQEFVLAKSVTFYLDDHQISYQKFSRALETVSQMRYSPGSEPESIREGNRAIRQGQSLRNLRDYFQSPQKGEFPLYALLAQSSNNECTEPRDRIYSLLNLVRNQDGEFETPIPVSYTVPLHEIFTNATRQALMEVQSLAPLSWASAWFDGDAIAAEFPSWVPAYHLFRAVRGPETSLDGALPAQDSDLTMSSQRRCFSASGRLRRDKNEQAFEGTTASYSPELEIYGVAVDRVAIVGQPNNRQKMRFRASWLDLVASIGSTYPNGDSVAQALMMTAFAGKYNSSSVFKATVNVSTWENAKRVWCDLICSSLAVSEARAEGKDLLTEENARTLDSLHAADGHGFVVPTDRIAGYDGDLGDLGAAFRGLLAGEDQQNLADCMANALDNRVMFTTANGYIGLGPIGTLTGDGLWILPGSSVPFIFRHRHDEHYRHVGEAYVHGIMFGEAVPDAKVKLESVVLS